MSYFFVPDDPPRKIKGRPRILGPDKYWKKVYLQDVLGTIKMAILGIFFCLFFFGGVSSQCSCDYDGSIGGALICTEVRQPRVT